MSKNGKTDSRGGRPKGSKSLGIPTKSITEAIQIAKTLYENAHDKTMSIEDFAKYLGLEKAGSSPVAGALSAYGLIERSGIGWRISDLGKRIINDDIDAIKGALRRNEIFKDLLAEYENEEVTSGLVVEYLKKNYKKGGNVFIIADRFLESITYIKQLERGMHFDTTVEQKPKIGISSKGWLTLLRLKYALSPPTPEEIENLLVSIEDEFAESDDPAIVSLVAKMKSNSDKKEVLSVLADSLIEIIGEKYPELKT